MYKQLSSTDLTNLIQLKEVNPDLKLMIALANNFRQISTNLREEFAEHLVKFLIDYNLDGADIDWEFPTFDDRENFVLLLEELKRSLHLHRKTLTIAVNPCLLSDNNGYDVPAIMENVDLVTLMLYDMHAGSWSNLTANHGNYWHQTSRYNMLTCIDTWLDRGAINEQLIIGIPAYSRNFQLDDPEEFGVGAKATFKDFGKPGEIPSTYSYNFICKQILYNGWRRYYEDVKSTGPYVVNGTTWAGYDDEESIHQKTMLVKNQNYGGVAFWSIDHDDYDNSCGNGTYPLVRSVWKNVVGRKASQ